MAHRKKAPADAAQSGLADAFLKEVVLSQELTDNCHDGRTAFLSTALQAPESDHGHSSPRPFDSKASRPMYCLAASPLFRQVPFSP